MFAKPSCVPPVLCNRGQQEPEAGFKLPASFQGISQLKALLLLNVPLKVP
jgi:hypothetical protein